MAEAPRSLNPFDLYTWGRSVVREVPGLDPEIIDTLARVSGQSPETIAEWFRSIPQDQRQGAGAQIRDMLLGSGDVELPEDDEARRERIRARRALRFGLRTNGFAVPFDVAHHITATLNAGGGSEMLLGRIIDDPRFRSTYPGIFDSAGGLKMTPAEYRQRATSLQSIGAQYGIRLTPHQVGRLIGGDVSDNEWDFRAKAAQMVRQNADVLVAFNQQVEAVNRERRRSGLKPLPSIRTAKEALDFFTQQAPKELYDVWEATSIQAAAKEYGVPVSALRARQIAQQTSGITGMDEAQKSFQEIAEALRTAGAELSAFGLTQQDLEVIEFGGKDRGALAARAQQALRQYEAGVRTDVEGETTLLDADRRPVKQAMERPGL